MPKISQVNRLHEIVENQSHNKIPMIDRISDNGREGENVSVDSTNMVQENLNFT